MAVFFCFGTTHFCNPCHDAHSRCTSTDKAEMPACPVGPVFQQLDQIIATSNGELAASVLLIAVFFSELNRTRVGWVDSERSNESWRTLRPSYRPGNVGFDPMKVSAKLDEKSFLAMQNKELNNGRLAMVGVAGMSAQELVTGAPIFA